MRRAISRAMILLAALTAGITIPAASAAPIKVVTTLPAYASIASAVGGDKVQAASISGGSEDRPHHWRAVNHLIAVNKLLGQENRVLMTNRAGHTPTPEAAAVIDAFFINFLK